MDNSSGRDFTGHEEEEVVVDGQEQLSGVFQKSSETSGPSFLLSRGTLCHRTPLLIIVQALFTACASLIHIHQYAEKSELASGKFVELNYTFSQSCIDRCRITAIDSFKIYRKIECPCGLYKKADSVTESIYSAIGAYFGGLAKFSGNAETTYHLSSLKTALKEEDLGMFRLEKEEADAYASMAQLLLRGFTDTYQHKKIRDYIRSANAPLQILLSKLEFIESRNLAGLLEFRKEQLFDHYRGLIKRPLSDYEKQMATSDYYEALQQTEDLEKGIAAYSRSLKVIALGHQKIFENTDKISGRELKETLTPYVNDIQDLISEFNKRKNR